MIPIRREWSAMKRLALLSPALATPAVEDTATGNPLTFVTDLARPLKSLLIHFTPKQASGTPSPDNILPITGWTEVNVFHAGKNLFDEANLTLYNRTISSTNGWIASNTAKSAVFKAKPNTKYYFKAFNSDVTTFRGCYITSDPETTPAPIEIYGYKSNPTFDITTGDGDVWIVVQATAVILEERNAKIMVCVGEQATEYEQFVSLDTYSASFPSTIYGGYVDMVTGEVWQTWDTYDLGNVATWGKSSTGNKYYGVVPAYKYADNDVFYCNAYKFDGVGNSEIGYYGNDYTIRYYYNRSLTAYEVYIRDDRYDTKGAFKEAIAGTIIAYPLETPVLITTLTPQQINAIKGNNTVWSDANGSMTAVYLKKK